MLNQIQDYAAHILSGQSPLVAAALCLLALALVAGFANFVVKKIILRLIVRLFGLDRDNTQDFGAPFSRMIARLANIVPAVIVIGGIGLIANLPAAFVVVVENVATAFIILSIALAITSALDIGNALYMKRKDAHRKPIKGYIEILKIAVLAVCAILVIAALVDKSPVILLSGLGAMAAVLMLVFQDTLLSLVASIQISSNDMVRVGDWIEMPQLNADGDVIDIALHTVKVQNWDKTITTLPTRRLISDPFKNWRGMQESGGRRIKRSIFIDQTSIHFLTDDERTHLQNFALLEDYLAQKAQELDAWNESLGEKRHRAVNIRRLTNVGTFRAYVNAYLRHHPYIHQGMTLLVRQLSPGAEGLPIEIYAFTNDTAWAAYENIQSDIFDHLYAILPQFGLRAFQDPSGHDIQMIREGLAKPA